MITIDFSDEEDVYARIETDTNNVKLIKKYLEEYKNLNTEEYNIDDFLSFLMEKEIKFNRINIKGDIDIYF